jgi:hypothetical protein
VPTPRSLTGDIQNVSAAELVEVKQQLAKLYTAEDGEDTEEDTEVRVTLTQIMGASMNISTSLSDAAVCEVFMKALTLDGYGATCTAAVSGDTYTFTLEYPLEPAVQVAAKTAEMKSFVVGGNLAEAMAAAAALLRRRRLGTLSVAGVNPPTTSVGAQVTIVVEVLASGSRDAYNLLQNQSRTVLDQAGSVNASRISSTLMAMVPNLRGLAVTAPTRAAYVETNAPPKTPPPLAPPPPPRPSSPQPSPPQQQSPEQPPTPPPSSPKPSPPPPPPSAPPLSPESETVDSKDRPPENDLAVSTIAGLVTGAVGLMLVTITTYVIIKRFHNRQSSRQNADPPTRVLEPRASPTVDMYPSPEFPTLSRRLANLQIFRSSICQITQVSSDSSITLEQPTAHEIVGMLETKQESTGELVFRM